MIKATLTLIIILLFSSTCWCQSTDSINLSKANEEPFIVFTKVEQEAMFPGGGAAWLKHLQTNLKAELGGKYIALPKGVREATQTVIIKFIVDTEGNILHPQLANDGVHPKLVKEAIRVITAGPRWIPAKQNGRNVNFQTEQRITFAVRSDFY
jgi:periplasmic protein TonB